jgi:short subunit dehydrogenase-like uncharacterized protein
MKRSQITTIFSGRVSIFETTTQMSSAVLAAKDLDIVVYGATGFTGQLVVEYLAEVILASVSRSLRVGVAGRNRRKLDEVKREAVAKCEAAQSIEVIEASSDDVTTLDAMTRRTRVLISTVGPYLLFGEPVVEACVRNNCDYVDLTGEVPFIRNTIAKFHAVAERKAVAIVHCCGFDSVPSDLGALFVQDYVARQHGTAGHTLARLHGFVAASRGGASGGTIASIANLFATVPSASSRRRCGPTRSCPTRCPPRCARASATSASRATTTSRAPTSRPGSWSRSTRASCAARRRSATAARTPTPSVLLMPNALLAYAASLAMLVVMLLLALAPTRWLLLKFVLPSTGQGPDRQTVLNGFFKLKFVGFTALGPSAVGAPRRIAATVEGKRDPGYGWTARCITECALALLSRKECRIGATGGGVLTPASAIGTALFAGLERAGTKFTIVEDIETTK